MKMSKEVKYNQILKMFDYLEKCKTEDDFRGFMEKSKILKEKGMNKEVIIRVLEIYEILNKEDE